MPLRTIHVSSIDNTPSTGTLTLSATDNYTVTTMRFVNGTNLASASWQPFDTTLSWQLGTGDGQHVVSGQFRDVALNVSDPVSDTIILDTLPPGGEIYTITESSPYAQSTGHTVYYGDDGSGQFQVQVQATDKRSGLDRAEFPAVTSAGGTDGTPQGGAYQFAHTYAFTAGVSTAAGNYDVRV